MKSILHYLFWMHLFFGLIVGEIYSQDKPKHELWRVYEDNDFLNIRGRGTDRAYSGGTRLDVFIERSKKPLLIPGIANVRQDSMVFIHQWGVMQMIFTPNDIDDPYFQPHDYFYSGALFLAHSAQAYNRVRRYSFQTEMQLGIRGPAAFGKETQTWVHRMIEYRLPKGWENQLKNVPILNVNFTLEKQVAAASSWLELIAGTKWRMGTLENGISFYPLLRIGLMSPYFNGYISQFAGGRATATQKRKIQAYLVIRPEVKWMLTNGLLQVNSFSVKEVVKPNSGSYVNIVQNNDGKQDIIRHFVYSANYGAVISTGKFAISYMQNSSTEMRKKTYSHEFGNISLYFNL